MRTDPTADGAATITAEVIRNALAVTVEEASIVVVRAAHSFNIQEGADAAGALLDARGQLVAQSAATSVMHSASLRCGLAAITEDVALDDMRPGDVYASNDPYRGGIHANDIMVLRPIFAGGRVRWFGGTLIHVADMGGTAVGGLGALATSTYDEGVLLPTVRLYEEGRPNRDVLSIIERNSRTPTKVIGDIQALVAGVNVIAKRVEELVDRYGADVLGAHMDDYLDYAERRLRDALAQVPSGTYRGSFTVDSDGVTPGRTFEVVATVTLGEGEVTVDFTGTAAQSGGAVNASFSQTLSGVIYAIRCLVDPSIPMNEGCFRLIHTVLPAGSLVNPDPPAACGGRMVTVAAVVEAILAALSGALPERAVAASGLVHVYTLSGVYPTGERWLVLGYEFGGIGRPPGHGRPRRHGGLLPRWAVGHPPDRTAGGTAPVRGRTVRAGARLRRPRPMAGRARPGDVAPHDRPRGADGPGGSDGGPAAGNIGRRSGGGRFVRRHSSRRPARAAQLQTTERGARDR